MNKTNVSTVVTLWINRAVAVLMGVLLFALPSLLDWYAKYRILGDQGRWALIISFYCCAVFVFVALWVMDGLLRSIRRGEVFVRQNVREGLWQAHRRRYTRAEHPGSPPRWLLRSHGPQR